MHWRWDCSRPRRRASNIGLRFGGILCTKTGSRADLGPGATDNSGTTSRCDADPLSPNETPAISTDMRKDAGSWPGGRNGWQTAIAAAFMAASGDAWTGKRSEVMSLAPKPVRRIGRARAKTPETSLPKQRRRGHSPILNCINTTTSRPRPRVAGQDNATTVPLGPLQRT